MIYDIFITGSQHKNGSSDDQLFSVRSNDEILLIGAEKSVCESMKSAQARPRSQAHNYCESASELSLGSYTQ